MNALTTAPVSYGGGNTLIPRDMREAMDLAAVMAKAGFLAKELQTIGGALFIIEQAGRWNMSPFAVALETAFPQGKPMFSGKVVGAALTSSGAINGRLHYAYDGKGDDRTITVSGTVRGEAEQVSIVVRLGDVKTANKMWQTQPDQQLAYHGNRVWARRYAPHVMLGVYSEEEMPEPAREPIPAARGPVINSTAEPARAPASAGYDGPPLIMLRPDNADQLVCATPGQWQKRCIAAIDRLLDVHELRQWSGDMEAHMAGLPDDVVQPVREAAAARASALMDAEGGEAPE